MADYTNYPELTDELLQKFIGQALQQAMKPQDTGSPLTSGLLAAGLGVMAGSRGRNFGEALGQGGLLGLQAYGSAKEAQKKDPMQMISLLNSIEDLKANRDMSQLFKGLGPQASGTPQFQPAPGVPAAAPQVLRGMFDRGASPEGEGGLYGSMVTPPPTFTGNVPPVERLYPLLARPKTSAAAQNLAEILGYKPQTVAPGGTVMVGGKPTYTAPNLGEGQKLDEAGNATFITDYLKNIEALKAATARGTKTGEQPFEPPTPVPTGVPGETQLMSRAGQIAIGNRNAERFLQPTQQPSPPTGLQPTAELQDYLAKNGIPNRIDPNTGQLLIGKAADAYSRPEASQRPLGPLGASAQPTPQGPPPRMGVDPGKVAEAVATKTAEAPIEQESKYQQGLITQNLKLRESILADATAARANSANIDRFMQLNKDPNVAKGRFAETFSGLKNAAASFGVDVKGLPAEQAMQSISSQMALQLRNPASGGGMPGAMSDSDRNFLTAMTPSLAQSKEGRELVAETFQAVNNRNVEVSRMLLKHEMDGGKVDSAFLKKLADHADKNPIFGEEQQKKLAQIMEAPTAPAAPKVTGMTRNYHIDNIIKNGSPEDIQKLRDRGLIQ